MSDDIPEVKIESAGESFRERVSIIWLVPVAALLIAIGIAWSTWSERGPLIEIAFTDAGGVSPRETELRYRDVAVGIVERVRFTPSLDKVLVSIRLDKDVEDFVDEDAEFWIVEPEITTTGISGLETVLSGVYIEGYWDAEPGGFRARFEGRDDAPLLTAAQSGLRLELRSSRDSGLVDNTPILFKGIEVGRVGPASVSRDGNWVFAEAIIFEPHDRLVTTATRFWDTSGFTFKIGPNGAELDFMTIASLIAGGLTFDTLVSGGQRVGDGMVFEVYPDEASARNSVFEDSDGTTVTISVLFEDNVSGLSAESPVEWRGVRIGEVANVTGLVDAERFGDERVRLLATLELTPSRFGLTGEISEADALAFLSERVDEGLRARLISASILTGGLKVELLTVEDAEPATLVTVEGDPFPYLPTTESEIADVSATAEGVFQRINALPIEELLQSAIGFLDNATAFVTSEDMRETPGDVRALLADVRGVVGSDEIQALPAELSAVMGDIRAATGDLREIVAQVAEAETVARLTEAIEKAGAAAEAAETTLAELPALTEKIGAVADKAGALPLEDLVAEVTGVAEEARGLIASDAARALPERLGEAVARLEAVLASLDEDDAAGRLTAALTAAEEAAGAVENAVAGMPQVVQRIDNIAAKAEDLPLERIAEELADVLETADVLIGDAAETELPAALSGALKEIETALAELREGGLIENANETLASAREAAGAIERAARDLPSVVSRINSALGQAQLTLAGYDEGSTFGRQAQAALRDVEKAAEALASLARSIERRPNSIILGR